MIFFTDSVKISYINILYICTYTDNIINIHFLSLPNIFIYEHQNEYSVNYFTLIVDLSMQDRTRTE